jgi:hypothetical protein
VEEDGIARRGVDPAQVLDADHVAGAGPARGGVDEPAAGDDLRHRLDSQAPHARGVGELGNRPAVVAAVADLQVAERVEVRAELHRRRDLLDHPVDVVVAHATVLVGVVGCGHEGLAEEPPREDRDVLVQLVAEVVHPPLADEAQRFQALGLVHEVEHAALVVGAERRRPPTFRRCHSEDHGVAKLGNRVKPPSTKIVWPVM